MASDGPPLVTLERVGLAYGSHVVIRDLSLEVRPDETLGILGRVGAGKTRILRLIAGLEIPDSGQVRFADGFGPGKIGYVFQHDTLIPWLSVRENLDCAKRATSPDSLDFGIRGFLNLRPHQLSGGMRQKVNLARGFVNGDRLVLMDEPFAMLDPTEKLALIGDFLAVRARSSTAAVFVTHDVHEALVICDRISFLSSRTHTLAVTVDNPFRGQVDEARLYAEPSYRQLLATFAELYRSEGSPS